MTQTERAEVFLKMAKRNMKKFRQDIWAEENTHPSRSRRSYFRQTLAEQRHDFMTDLLDVLRFHSGVPEFATAIAEQCKELEKLIARNEKLVRRLPA